jgi:hypothetical protein
MRLILCEFISLDGAVQAPGGTYEDTDGLFIDCADTADGADPGHSRPRNDES